MMSPGPDRQGNGGRRYRPGRPPDARPEGRRGPRCRLRTPMLHHFTMLHPA